MKHYNIQNYIRYKKDVEDTIKRIDKKPEYYDNKYHTSEYSKFVGRKKLLWDGDNMKITNFDEANQFVGRTRRPGWNLQFMRIYNFIFFVLLFLFSCGDKEEWSSLLSDNSLEGWHYYNDNGNNC